MVYSLVSTINYHISVALSNTLSTGGLQKKIFLVSLTYSIALVRGRSLSARQSTSIVEVFHEDAPHSRSHRRILGQGRGVQELVTTDPVLRRQRPEPGQEENTTIHFGGELVDPSCPGQLTFERVFFVFKSPEGTSVR